MVSPTVKYADSTVWLKDFSLERGRNKHFILAWPFLWALVSRVQMLILCLHSNGIRAPQYQHAQNEPVIFLTPGALPGLLISGNGTLAYPSIQAKNPRVVFKAPHHHISIYLIPGFVSSCQVLHSIHLSSSFLWHCLILSWLPSCFILATVLSF